MGVLVLESVSVLADVLREDVSPGCVCEVLQHCIGKREHGEPFVVRQRRVETQGLGRDAREVKPTRGEWLQEAGSAEAVVSVPHVAVLSQVGHGRGEEPEQDLRGRVRAW